MNLKELNLIEEDLMRKVEALQGLMQDKVINLKLTNVFDKYREVYRQYIKLLDDKNQNLEALKRAIFIQWYSVSEPGCFTGIPGGGGPFDSEDQLDLDLERNTLEYLENKIINNEIDYELKWMLAWYYSITDYYFDNFKGLSDLKKFFKEKKESVFEKGIPEKQYFLNRGQMGDYWLSVFSKYYN